MTDSSSDSPAATWLWAARHGQSTANAALESAARRDAVDARLSGPSHEAPLTALGRGQTARLAGRLTALKPDARPQVVMCSPYTRARQTAEIIVGALGDAVSLHGDDRLVDRSNGILSGLTPGRSGNATPDEQARREPSGRSPTSPREASRCATSRPGCGSRDPERDRLVGTPGPGGRARRRRDEVPERPAEAHWQSPQDDRRRGSSSCGSRAPEGPGEEQDLGRRAHRRAESSGQHAVDYEVAVRPSSG